MIQTLSKSKLLAVVLAAVVVFGGGVAAVPATVLDGAVQQTDGPSSTVSVQPADATVDVGDTTTIDVVVDSAAGGVGAYNVTVSLSDSSVASITDVEFGGDPGLTETPVESDSTVTARAALADTDQTGSVTILTVTVEGVTDGTTDVTTQVNALGTEAGVNYAVTDVTDATLTVGEGDTQPAPANYDVSNLDAPDTATAGDTIEVSADVENTGEQADTQTVEFRLDLNQDGTLSEDEALTSQEVALEPGETETVTFAGLDTTGLSGEYAHGVFTDDDSATATITVEEPAPPAPTADVTFADQTSDGTTVVVDSVTMSEGGFVAIHNSSLFEGNVIGSVVGVSDYLAPGTHEDVEVTLYDVPGASFNVERLPADEELVAMPHLDTDGDEQYGFVATGGDVDGPYTEDGSPVIDTAQITLEQEPANFDVSNLDAPDTVDEGDLIEVSADVTNTGEQADTQTVEFRLDLNQDDTLAEDEALASQEVELAPGETETVTFSDLDTSGLDGEYAHGVFSDDDNATATIEVDDDDPAPEPANFDVASLTAPESATQGDAIDVSAEVTNTGEETATKTVEFRLDLNQDGTLSDEEVLTSQEIELEPGETETVTFADLDTSPLAPGTYTHGVFTDDDSETAEITVEKPAPPAPSADVTFADQTSDGTTVVVDSVTMSEGGFVAIHDSSLNEGAVISSVVGVSDYLAPGTHEDVEITLFDVPGRDFDRSALEESQPLIAMPHLDTDGDEEYGFVATGGEVDGPYTEDGAPVVDTAQITVETDEPEVGYYQIDFIGGEPYVELGPEADNGFYADDDEDRLFRYAFGNTEDGVTDLGTAWPSAELRGCVDYQHISQDGDTASITFTVNESCEDVTLSLAVYEKDDPGFDRDMVQVLSDSDTGTFGPGTYTLTVELPDSDDSDE
jgi:signal recognition particle receptor subunit beta